MFRRADDVGRDSDTSDGLSTTGLNTVVVSTLWALSREQSGVDAPAFADHIFHIVHYLAEDPRDRQRTRRKF